MRRGFQYRLAGFHGGEERRERRRSPAIWFQRRKWGRSEAAVGELARRMLRMSVRRAESGADGALPCRLGVVICTGTADGRGISDGRNVGWLNAA